MRGERYGEPPTIADWDPARACTAGHLWRVRLLRTWRLVVGGAVRRHYGTFGQAVAAARFRRRSHGGRSQWDAECRGHTLNATPARAAPTPDVFPEHLARRVPAVADSHKSAEEDMLRLALIALAEGAREWASHLDGAG